MKSVCDMKVPTQGPWWLCRASRCSLSVLDAVGSSSDHAAHPFYFIKKKSICKTKNKQNEAKEKTPRNRLE